jgi:hypothetical protein
MTGRMKTLAVALAGAVALALPSAANATLTITAPTTVTVSSANQISSIEWRIDFTDTNNDSPFSDTVSWNNDEAGVYWFRVITNAFQGANGPDDVDITAAFITGTGILSPINLLANPGNTDLTELYELANLGLTAGTFTLTVEGTRGANPEIGGHVDATGVPEPATWMLMLLGFGAIGFGARRSRRKAALAQLA